MNEVIHLGGLNSENTLNTPMSLLLCLRYFTYQADFSCRLFLYRMWQVFPLPWLLIEVRPQSKTSYDEDVSSSSYLWCVLWCQSTVCGTYEVCLHWSTMEPLVSQVISLSPDMYMHM